MERQASGSCTRGQTRGRAKSAAQAAIAAAFVFSLLLLGCAMPGSPGSQAPQGGNQSAAQQQAQDTGFSMPNSTVAYSAYYIVKEGGQETGKTVYRMGEDMRTDYEFGGENISVYFLGNKAYSCALSIAGGYQCFDITAQAAAQGVEALVGMPDLENAQAAETVSVGQSEQMTAKCYIFSAAPYFGRKRCFTDSGIPAYDEYTLSDGQKHVEYLSYIRMDAGLQVFGLPVAPKMAPQNMSGSEE